ncbi:MAG TPA: hypothetical protein VGC08_01605 [Pedobacter sp.]
MTRYAEEDIIPIVIHILSFSTVKFAAYGYKALMEKEMPELLVLDEDDVDPEMHFQVLNVSEDEVSKAINQCIELIDATIDTFRIMYALDMVTLYTDERIHELANDLYHDLYSYAEGLIDDDISSAVMELPFTTANAFFFLCRLIIHHEIDAEQSMDEGFYGKGWKEYEFLDTSDNNVAVLYSLTEEILKMNILITEIYAGRSRHDSY